MAGRDKLWHTEHLFKNKKFLMGSTIHDLRIIFASDHSKHVLGV